MSKTTDIRTAVEAELKFDPLVDDADIHVAVSYTHLTLPTTPYV